MQGYGAQSNGQVFRHSTRSAGADRRRRLLRLSSALLFSQRHLYSVRQVRQRTIVIYTFDIRPVCLAIALLLFVSVSKIEGEAFWGDF